MRVPSDGWVARMDRVDALHILSAGVIPSGTDKRPCLELHQVPAVTAHNMFHLDGNAKKESRGLHE